jgi:hypothetical protein
VKKFLISISIVGALLFGTLFGLTYKDTQWFEDSAKTWVALEIERKIQMDFPDLFPDSKEKPSNKILAKLKGNFEKRIKELREKLLSDLPARIAVEIARWCTCRMRIEDKEAAKRKFEEIRVSVRKDIVAKLKENIKSKTIGLENVNALIKGHYIKIIEQLLNDFRIFSGSNVLIFLSILILSMIKTEYEKALMAAGVLVTCGTLISIGIYIFNQNWFHALLFNDYMGWGYLVYVATITGFLADVILNKGKISSHVVGFIIVAIGAALSACS